MRIATLKQINGQRAIDLRDIEEDDYLRIAGFLRALLRRTPAPAAEEETYTIRPRTPLSGGPHSQG